MDSIHGSLYEGVLKATAVLLYTDHKAVDTELIFDHDREEYVLQTLPGIDNKEPVVIAVIPY